MFGFMIGESVWMSVRSTMTLSLCACYLAPTLPTENVMNTD